jgi:hypothetical protein
MNGYSFPVIKTVVTQGFISQQIKHCEKLFPAESFMLADSQHFTEDILDFGRNRTGELKFLAENVGKKDFLVLSVPGYSSED